jgi:hypothetical protein
MKDFVSKTVLVLLVGLVVSCAGTSTHRPISEFPNANVIGNVQVTFEMTLPNRVITESVKQAAYMRLLEGARKEYQGNIDICDIAITVIEILKPATNYIKLSAVGKVFIIGGGNSRNAAIGVEGALERAANDVSKDFTPRSRIAIVQITAPDRNTRDFMIGELEYILQQQGYYMVDRAQLDKIFEEQRFGASSDVDDNTAARMGKIAGASIVITGRIDGEGNLRRLRLRALNTETAQVVGTASERL